MKKLINALSVLMVSAVLLTFAACSNPSSSGSGDGSGQGGISYDGTEYTAVFNISPYMTGTYYTGDELLYVMLDGVDKWEIGSYSLPVPEMNNQRFSFPTCKGTYTTDGETSIVLSKTHHMHKSGWQEENIPTWKTCELKDNTTKLVLKFKKGEIDVKD